ncbi:hypothetical protein C2E23DRAFT_719354 [Lenzites betulinus]|nr:hypothetical protein C2E23DRAFT_719354 [Lenzites betulinus]
MDEYSFDEYDAEDPAYDPCPNGLGMPSDYTHEERNDFDIIKLAQYELQMRIGLAFDQLDAVRMAVKHRAAHIEHKRKHARGGKANTAAQGEIKKADMRARVLATRYNDNYVRITSLRPSDYAREDDTTPGARLRIITPDHDLAIANMSTPRSLHDSQRSGSWIWGTATETSGMCYMDIVQWFRAKAEKDRADEAVNRLCAEFRRTALGFETYASMWRQSADSQARGARAYAYKTAAMWSSMARACTRSYDSARRPGVSADTLDQTRVSDKGSFTWCMALMSILRVYGHICCNSVALASQSLSRF